VRYGSKAVKTVILKAGGEVEVREHDKKLTLEEMQAIVGGYVEISSGWYENAGRQMVVNEEGAIRGLPFNLNATVAYRAEAHRGKGPWSTVNIYGDVFLPLNWRLS
jgi:hypothetical protein